MHDYPLWMKHFKTLGSAPYDYGPMVRAHISGIGQEKYRGTEHIITKHSHRNKFQQPTFEFMVHGSHQNVRNTCTVFLTFSPVIQYYNF